MAGIKNNQMDPADPRIMDQVPSDPSISAGQGSYYIKDVSGNTELFYKDSGGNVIQITAAGAINGAGGGSLNGLSDVILSSPLNGQVLTYNGSEWVNQTPSGGGGSIVDDAYNEASWNGDTTQGASRNALRDKFETIVEADGSIATHSDVDLTGLSLNDFLQYDGANWVPVALAGGGDMLSTNNLSDVASAATSLSNLGGLSTSHESSVANHSDVDLTGLSTNDYLQYDGANWVPVTLAAGGDLVSTNNLSDVADAATSLSNLGGLSSSHAASVGNHTDVDLTGIADGQILKWVAVSSEFQPANESGGGGSISDVAYPTGWNGDTTQGASRNALFDKLDAMDTTIASAAGNEGQEYKIQLGAGSTIADKVSAAPVGGIPAGWSVVDATDGAVDAQLAGAIDNIVLIHGLGEVCISFSIVGGDAFGGWVNRFPSGSDTFAPGDLKTESNNENQTLIKNFNTAVGNQASFIIVKFFPILP